MSGMTDAEFVDKFSQVLRSVGLVEPGVPWLARRREYAGEELLQREAMQAVEGSTTVDFEVLIAFPHGARHIVPRRWRLSPEGSDVIVVDKCGLGKAVYFYVEERVDEWSEAAACRLSRPWVFVGPGFRRLGFDVALRFIGAHWVVRSEDGLPAVRGAG